MGRVTLTMTPRTPILVRAAARRASFAANVSRFPFPSTRSREMIESARTLLRLSDEPYEPVDITPPTVRFRKAG